MNGSTGPKSGSPSSSTPPDPLDRAREAIEEGREATKLLDYSEDFDEPTGRHEVTVNLHGPSPSQHDIEKPTNVDVTMTVAKRLHPAVLAVLVLVLGLAAIVACAVTWIVTHAK